MRATTTRQALDRAKLSLPTWLKRADAIARRDGLRGAGLLVSVIRRARIDGEDDRGRAHEEACASGAWWVRNAQRGGTRRREVTPAGVGGGRATGIASARAATP